MLAALGHLTVAEELVILPTVGMSDDSKYGRAGENGKVMQYYCHYSNIVLRQQYTGMHVSTRHMYNIGLYLTYQRKKDGFCFTPRCIIVSDQNA